MNNPGAAHQATQKPARHIGGSILPSSDPSILKPQKGLYGTFQVRPIPELDTHGLYFENSQLFSASQLIATHANGYSCNSLAERILSVWNGERDVTYAMEQFDYILRCGGMGRHPDTIALIARGKIEATD